jgi:hypothetical protein
LGLVAEDMVEEESQGSAVWRGEGAEHRSDGGMAFTFHELESVFESEIKAGVRVWTPL